MAYDPDLLDCLERVEPVVFDDSVFRHMFAGKDPITENRSGARWNPPDVPAVYTSLERKTCLAEANWRISLEPVPLRPDLRRTLYTVHVIIDRVLDIRSEATLAELGIEQSTMEEFDFRLSQEVGGAVAYLGCGGFVVPSVRAPGSNFVILPGSLSPRCFEIVVTDELPGGEGQ